MSQAIHNNSDRPWNKLVWGLILIGLGCFFMLSRLGFVPYDLLSVWWPVFVIAAGVGSLLSARSPRGIGSGVTTIGIGAWLLVATNEWFGLGWSRSWPLVLVAAGLGSLTQALAHAVWPRGGSDHVL